MDNVGMTNPNIKEWFCTRNDCVPCQGRKILGAEEAEGTIKRADGYHILRRMQEDRKALPSCTGEGFNFVIPKAFRQIASSLWIKNVRKAFMGNVP